MKHCEHRNWYIYRRDAFSFGTCLDCDAQITLGELINQLQTRIEQLEGEIKHGREQHSKAETL